MSKDVNIGGDATVRDIITGQKITVVASDAICPYKYPLILLQ